MDTIVIEGVHPYDGRYPFDLVGQELTTREWGWIKRLSGYLPLTVDYTDPEVLTVFACIALRRTGKVQAQDVPAVFDRLSDAPFGSAITLETEPVEEGDADSPPPSSSSSNGADSGHSSPTSSETSAADPGSLWDARLGFFGVSPTASRRALTPAQLLGCVDLFHGLCHGGGD